MTDHATSTARLSLVPPADGVPDAPASAELALVEDLLGEEGLRAVPGITATDLAQAAAELVTRLLGVDDCWLQPAGPFAEELVRQQRRYDGPVLLGATGDPEVPTSPGQRLTGTVRVSVVHCEGRDHALVAWTRLPRTWSKRDVAFLAASAAALATGLTDLGSRQTPAQQARREFAGFQRDLLVTMNHELRTPLAVISGVLELMEDDTPETEVVLRRHLARLDRNVARLLDLADNVTMLAGGVPEPLRRDEARCDLRQVAQVIATDSAAQGREVVVAPGPPLLARIAEDDFRELLERVVGNAVKFTAPGTSVEVGLGAVASGDLEVTVRDEGIGIPESEQHRIGEHFFRSSTAQEREHQGAGLGLAAAMAIVHRWDGEMVIDSSPGRGTTVRIRLIGVSRRQGRVREIL